jgi:hypothetical protein
MRQFPSSGGTSGARRPDYDIDIFVRIRSGHIFLSSSTDLLAKLVFGEGVAAHCKT